MYLRTRLATTTAGIVLLAFAPLWAQTPFTIPLSSPLPLDTSVVVGSLPNGLRYYVRTNRKPEKRAELRLVVNAGSILEDDAQRGLAHFTEHMAFNGTHHFAKQEIINYLESVGVRFGPDLNASTGFDETVYMLQIPTDTPSIVARGFEILEEWAHEVSEKDADIDKERGVIMEEWRLGRGAGARIRDKQFPVLFSDSRYAERLPIGKPEIIQGCNYDTLRRFYRDWYRPDLMAVIAVGDFDKNAIEQRIRETFSRIPSQIAERKREIYPVPPHSQTLFSIATDPELTVTSVDVYYKHPVMSDTLVGDYRREIIDGLFTDMLNNRLDELTRKADPPYINAYGSYGRLVRTEEFFALGSEVKDGGILRGLSTVMAETERVRRFGFTQTELGRAKSDMLRQMEAANTEKGKTESNEFVSEYIRNFLQHEPSPGISFEYGLYKRFIPEITLEEVNHVGTDWITKDNRVITVSAPAKSEATLPSNDELARTIDVVDSAGLSAYVDVTTTDPLLRIIPHPGKIVERKNNDTLGITEIRLSNGAKVVLKPTTFKNDEILFSSVRDGGTSLAADSDYIAALTATAVLQESGLDGFDRILLEKKLAGKIVRVSPFMDEFSEGVGGSASPQDLTTLFQLIYLTFTAPRGDSSAFVSYASRMKSILQNRGDRPESVFEDTVQVTMSQHSFRRRPINVPMLDEMNLARSMAMYRDRFSNAAGFTFFFVGNFTVAEITPLIETYLATLPSTDNVEHWKDLRIEPPSGVVNRTVHRGIEPKSLVRLYFTGPFTWTRENRFAISSLAEVLRIKLREALREEKGGTYGVGVSAAPSRIPQQRYRLVISFGCAPERVEELTHAVFQQIDSLQRFGPDSSYIAKVRETDLREREVSLKQNGFWLTALQFCRVNEINPEQILTYADLIRSITPEIVRDAANSYLDTGHYARFVLLPENSH